MSSLLCPLSPFFVSSKRRQKRHSHNNATPLCTRSLLPSLVDSTPVKTSSSSSSSSSKEKKRNDFFDDDDDDENVSSSLRPLFDDDDDDAFGNRDGPFEQHSRRRRPRGGGEEFCACRRRKQRQQRDVYDESPVRARERERTTRVQRGRNFVRGSCAEEEEEEEGQTLWRR